MFAGLARHKETIACRASRNACSKLRRMMGRENSPSHRCHIWITISLADAGTVGKLGLGWPREKRSR